MQSSPSRQLTGVATLFDGGHTPFGTNYNPLTVGGEDLLICARREEMGMV